MNSIIFIAAILLGGYFIYLLFTQPRAAADVLIRVFMVIGKIFYFIAKILYGLLLAIYNFISNIIRKRR